MQTWNWAWVSWSASQGSIATYSADVDLGSSNSVIAFAAISSFCVENATLSAAGITHADDVGTMWSDFPFDANPNYAGTTQHLLFEWAIQQDTPGSSVVTVSYVVLST
jgi:hypothetical protein